MNPSLVLSPLHSDSEESPVLHEGLDVTPLVHPLTQRFPELFECMALTGIHPYKKSRGAAPEYFDEEVWQRGSPHIGEHCIAVAITALSLLAGVAVKLTHEDLHRLLELSLLHDVLKLFEISWYRERAGRIEEDYKTELALFEAWVTDTLLERGVGQVFVEKMLMASYLCSPEGAFDLLLASEPGVIEAKSGFKVEKLLIAADARTQTLTNASRSEWIHRVVTPKERIRELFARSPDWNARIVWDATARRLRRDESGRGSNSLWNVYTSNIWLRYHLVDKISDEPASPTVVTSRVQQWLSGLPHSFLDTLSAF